MYFYEIRLHAVPEIVFAYSVVTDHYRNRFPSRYTDLLEVSLVEDGTIFYDHDDGTHAETPPGTIAPILKDLHCRTYAAPGVVQKHVTVGTVVPYDLTRREIGEIADPASYSEAVQKNGTILIPYQWAADARYGEIGDQLRRIIALQTAQPPQALEAIGEWFRLAALLTDTVLERLCEQQGDRHSASAAYLREAKHYIAAHYAERLTVADVARHLGISAGHLHGIFQKQQGQGVIDYLNRYRVDIVKQFLRGRDISLKEAAHLVGVDDPSYMSRLFKKIEGVSFRQYCLRYRTKKR